ncbi:unnamed protein product, partial [marine sediment metagenome]
QDLNQVADMVVRRFVGGTGIDIRAIGGQIVIRGPNVRGNPLTAIVQRFRVKSQSNDYLTCRTWNPLVDSGEEGSVNIKVAKPYLLRRTPFDGESITYGEQTIDYSYTSSHERHADDGVDDEDQIIVPAYFVDDEILAVRNMAGGSGIDEIIWEDINNAGRFWAAVAEEE